MIRALIRSVVCEEFLKSVITNFKNHLMLANVTWVGAKCIFGSSTVIKCNDGKYRILEFIIREPKLSSAGSIIGEVFIKVPKDGNTNYVISTYSYCTLVTVTPGGDSYLRIPRGRVNLREFNCSAMEF